MTRYSIGQDAENGDLLIADSLHHLIIARSGAMAQDKLQELVDLANASVEIRDVCRRYNNPAVNLGCHSLALRVLGIIDKPAEGAQGTA